MINPLISILIAIGLYAGGTITGWKLNNDHRDALELKAVQAQKEALQVAAAEIAKVKVIQRNTTNILEKEIRTEKVYAECKHKPETLKLINDALVPEVKK